MERGSFRSRCNVIGSCLIVSCIDDIHIRSQYWTLQAQWHNASPFSHGPGVSHRNNSDVKSPRLNPLKRCSCRSLRREAVTTSQLPIPTITSTLSSPLTAFWLAPLVYEPEGVDLAMHTLRSILQPPNSDCSPALCPRNRSIDAVSY